MMESELKTINSVKSANNICIPGKFHWLQTSVDFIG